MEQALKRLLVVDDEPEWLSRLRDFLSPRGYEVKEASSVDEALRALNTDSGSVDFDEVVTDGLGGEKNWRRIADAAKTRGVAVTLLSGQVDDELADLLRPERIRALRKDKYGDLKKEWFPDLTKK